MSDDLSNKEMDDAEDRMRAAEKFAHEHAADNSADYVAGRYGFMCWQHGYPVPIKQDAAIKPMPRRLSPAYPYGQKRGMPRSAYPRGGIIVPLVDFDTGNIDDYYVETTGHNGVCVTGKVTSSDAD